MGFMVLLQFAMYLHLCITAKIAPQTYWRKWYLQCLAHKVGSDGDDARSALPLLLILAQHLHQVFSQHGPQGVRPLTVG